MSQHIHMIQVMIKRWAINIFFVTLLGFMPVYYSQAQQPTPQSNSAYQEIQRIGRGAVLGASWNPHENSFLVNSTQGAWIYGDTFHDEFHIADSQLAIFNPTGELLASVDKSQHTVSIWNVSKQKLVTTLPLDNETQIITLAAWNPDGQLLAVGGQTQVWIWNAVSQQLIQSLTLETVVSSIVFSPDGNWFAIGRVNNVDIYQVNDWHIVLTLTDVGGVPQIAWNPVNKLIATLAAHTPAVGISINSLKIWDATSGELKLVIQTELATTLAWSPDGTILATDNTQDQGYLLYSVQFWNPITGEQIGGLRSDVQRGTIHAISWSADGKYLLTAGEDNAVYLWNWPLDAKQTYKALQVHMGEVTSIAWNAKNHLLADTSSDAGTRVWDIAHNELVFTAHSFVKDVWSVAWNPDGDQIAIGDGQEPIRIWDISTQTEKANLVGHQASVLPNIARGVATTAWSPDGTLLASGGYDGTVHIWNISKGTTKLILQNRGWPVLFVQWSNDSKRLLSYDGAIVLWDVQTGKSIQKYTTSDNGNPFLQSTISPNEELVAAIGARLYIWDTTSGNLLNTAEVQGLKIAWNTDSSKLAIVTNGMDTNPLQNGLAVWEKETNQLTIIATEQPDPTAVIWIAPDELVVGFADGTISVLKEQ